MSQKVLMMDVDGVLVSGRPTDGRHLFAELEADLGLSPDRLRESFFTPYWEAIVTGREGLTERLAPVLAEIAPKVSCERLIAHWFENDSRVDQSVLSTVKRYRERGVSVFLATNQEHMRADYLMQKVGLGAHVDGIIYSADSVTGNPLPNSSITPPPFPVPRLKTSCWSTIRWPMSRRHDVPVGAPYTGLAIAGWMRNWHPTWGELVPSTPPVSSQRKLGPHGEGPALVRHQLARAARWVPAFAGMTSSLGKQQWYCTSAQSPTASSR